MLVQLPGFIGIDCYFTVKRFAATAAPGFPCDEHAGLRTCLFVKNERPLKSVCLLFIPYICAVTVPQQQPGYCGLKGNPVQIRSCPAAVRSLTNVKRFCLQFHCTPKRYGKDPEPDFEPEDLP